ncbi:MAG: hypothetical protein JWM05_1280 [Acidimicrobiales bacterium]|nr:hypothetical protein [Acidimicrobiales bacterium]
MRHRRFALVCGTLALLAPALVACGSKGSSSDSSTTRVKATPTSAATTAKPPPTTKPTTTTPTTTTTPLAPADPATRALADAGTIKAGDLGPGWVEYSKAKDRPVEPASCSNKAGGPETRLGPGALRQGATFQLGKAKGWLGAITYAFDSEASAVAWITAIKTPAWAECQRKQFEAFQQKSNKKLTVTIATLTSPSVGQVGFERYASFGTRDASKQVVAYTNFSFYRIGRLAIRLGVDVGSMSAAESKAFDAGMSKAIAAAYARVQALPGR